MTIQPYLFFQGRAHEAIEFYKSALGAEVVMMMHFKDAPSEGHRPTPPDLDDKVMHADLQIGDAHILISDGMGTGVMTFAGINVALSTDDDATTRKYFDGLSAGGEIHQPLIPTFYSTSFGMVVDKFGVGWIILTSSAPTA